MPPIRFMTVADNLVQFQDHKGITRTLTNATIPGGLTIAEAEDFVNNTWIPQNVTDYQMKIHIFTLTPLRVSVGTWAIGAVIPANWWAR